jgi:biofilm protein TabA
MVFDNISNCELYYSLNSGLKSGFDFIKNFLDFPLKEGKYEIDGDNVFALVQNYETKEIGEFESHIKYIDIQFVVSGEEIIEYEPVQNLEIKENQTPKSDMIFYHQNINAKKLLIKQGEFAIFFPNDGHKPGLKHTKNELVEKIVVKVKV